MSDSTDADTALLLDMLQAARSALSFLDGVDEARFRSSELHQFAMIRALEIIGEAAGKVSASCQAANPGIPWREITGMRHRLIHDYRDVRLEIVWFAVTERLAPLIAALEPLIPDEGQT